MFYKFVSFISTLFYICILKLLFVIAETKLRDNFPPKYERWFPQSIYIEDFEKSAEEGTLSIELESKHIFTQLSFLATPTFHFPLLENRREGERTAILW
jgi:hypothetical protein